MALKPPLIEEPIQHAVIDVFSLNDGKLSVEQQIEVYGKCAVLRLMCNRPYLTNAL